MPRTAREAFFNGPHRATFEKIVASESFDVAVEYALLAFYEEMPDTTGDPSMHWATHSQAIGAKRVLDLLRTMHLNNAPQKQSRLPTLKPPQ